jgi:DNA-binding response OmpR family regulator
MLKTPSTRRVLIIEDERELAELVKRHLEDSGFAVETAARGDDGLRAAETMAFDLILLDLMLPGMDGIEVCRRLRARNIRTPIVMVTARTTEVEKVLGLEMGADDYIAKPFGLAELTARIKAILRRIDSLATTSDADDRPIDLGTAVRIDPASRQVIVRGQIVVLTPKEFDLLLHFARNPGRVYSRSQLLDAVWGYSHEGYEHAVNCHINRLRGKIETNQARPELLLTVWGIGYKLADHAVTGT